MFSPSIAPHFTINNIHKYLKSRILTITLRTRITSDFVGSSTLIKIHCIACHLFARDAISHVLPQVVVLSGGEEGKRIGSALLGEEVCVTDSAPLPSVLDPKDTYSRLTQTLRET